MNGSSDHHQFHHRRASFTVVPAGTSRAISLGLHKSYRFWHGTLHTSIHIYRLLCSRDYRKSIASAKSHAAPSMYIIKVGVISGNTNESFGVTYLARLAT